MNPGIQRYLYKILLKVMPELNILVNKDMHFRFIKSELENAETGEQTQLYKPYHIYNSQIGDYTYIAQNAYISETRIGRFCSVGPNLLCGWGIHPVNTLSTHPMFYSTQKQNGITLSKSDKIEERKKITIGNDVMIGANVTILDGVTIGDGAIIGAGAIVSKDIAPYAIAVGSPIQISKYRYPPETIEKLLQIKWWNWEKDKLTEVEKYFDNVEEFVKKYSA